VRRITPLKTTKLIKLCEKLGWKRARIKGDHLALVKEGSPRPIIIKLTKMSPQWLILQTIKNLGITREEYFKLIKNI